MYSGITLKSPNFLPSFYLIKYIKASLPKGILFDTTIVSTLTLNTEIELFVLVKFVFFNFNINKGSNFFSNFVYDNKFLWFYLYNIPLFSVKSACSKTFTASLLLIPLITQKYSAHFTIKIATSLRLIGIIDISWHPLQTCG